MMIDLQWNRDFALEQAGDDEELLAELLDLLMDSSAHDLGKIKKAYEKGDAIMMGEAAHSIKGAAASLGVEKLREVAYEIEKAGREEDLAAAYTFLSSLESIIESLPQLK